jgi:hypothetical protein
MRMRGEDAVGSGKAVGNHVAFGTDRQRCRRTGRIEHYRIDAESGRGGRGRRDRAHGGDADVAEGDFGITGIVLGNGSSILQLGGAGADSFDVSQIGAAAQYQGFASYNKTDSSIWTLTGANAALQPWTVNGGTLLVDGTIANVTVPP